MTPDALTLSTLEKDDFQAAVQLVSLAMNAEEGRWAEKTLSRHFQCRQQGIADGRNYFVLKDRDAVIGLGGLHHYVWGPPRIVWLAWFAIHPEAQGLGLGTRLLGSIEAECVNRRYSKLLVETYDHPDFDKARSFYERMGFRIVGTIKDYLPDGSAMIVYGKSIPE